MADLKLPRLPERTPVKLTIAIQPALAAALGEYAECYAKSYGQVEPLSELIPAILATFLDADRDFQRSRRKGPT